MRPNVIIAQHDPASAASLALSLMPHCRTIRVVGSREELSAAVPRHRADLVVADLEMLNMDEIEALHEQFRQLAIVCTHRVPDEEMWAKALRAGAVDCCSSDDVPGIVGIATHQQSLAKSIAA
jgi:chemotaxis response regulator CheB